MRLIDTCSDALVPGLTRRLLLAVLATLAPAVAASPAGAAGHATALRGAERAQLGHRRHLHDPRYRERHRGRHRDDPLALRRGADEQPRDQRRDDLQGRRRDDPPDVLRHRRRLLGLARRRRAAAGARLGLQTIKLGSSVPVRVGQTVVARGNAEGRGGAPKAAPGRVIALHRQIVARDESGESETLSNVIATNAPVVPGDSGGPLEDARNRALGMVTAGVDLGRAPRLRNPDQAGAHLRAPDREREVERDGPRRADGVPRRRPQGRSGGAQITQVVPQQARGRRRARRRQTSSRR